MRSAYVEQQLDQVDTDFADVEDLFERLAHMLADNHFASGAVLDLVALGQRDREFRFYFLLEV